jgi:hypothetical protein
VTGGGTTIMEAAIYRSEFEAERRLRELGLTRDGVLSAVRAAVAAVHRATRDYPPISGGLMAWMEAVARLRQEFRPNGWEADDTGNFSTIVDHSTRTKIAVANTDEGTGVWFSQPTNRSKRGELSRLAIEANQLALPFTEWLAEPEEAKIPGYATWYLCLFIRGDTVKAELSLPTSCASGYFGGWSERIILLSGDEDWMSSNLPQADNGPDFEVKVERK